MNKTVKLIFVILASIFGLIGFATSLIIIFNPAYKVGNSIFFDPNLASNFGTFFGGLVGTIFSILSVFLLIYTIINQNSTSRKSALESHFFKMIDYHNQNVNQFKIAHLDSTRRDDFSEGRRAFVQFKIQIHRLFEIVNLIIQEKQYNLTKEQVIDIVYIIFYYGIDGSWINFIENKLERYTPIQRELAESIQNKINSNPHYKIGRTNQTNLSTYFRNMYNAIKLIDESKELTDIEKKELIKIYRAQFSNPELYVIFFNIMSRFGKKWKENNYVLKYELIKNLPHNYCEDYNPNTYFPMKYEDDEY